MRKHLTSIAIIFLIFIGFYACSESNVGGVECRYEGFEYKAKVINWNGQGESINEVEFKLEDSGHVTLNQWDLTGQVEFDFEIELLRDKTMSFIVKGDKIKKGTCTPYSVKKVELEKIGRRSR